MQEKKQNEHHILWIDGIKGISCLFIVVTHIFLALFPSIYYGPAKESKLFGIDTYLSSSPFGIIFNGNFFVFLFLFVSGYVITYQILRIQPEFFGLFHIKRYLKLTVPLFLYCILFFILSKLSPDYVLSYISEMKELDNISLFMTLKQGLYKILFFGDINYGGQFWMMHHIFLGGLFTSIIATLSWSLGLKNAFIISVFFSFLLLLNITIHFLAIFLASTYCIFNYMHLKKWSEVKTKYLVFFNCFFTIILFISIILGAYPSGYAPKNFYKYLILPVKVNRSSEIYHTIAATLFFISVSNLKYMQRFFESKLCLFLAKISYSAFIFHGIILDYSYPILFHLNIDNYILSSFIYFFVALSAVIVFAYISTKIIFIPIGKKINRFFDKKTEHLLFS